MRRSNLFLLAAVILTHALCACGTPQNGPDGGGVDSGNSACNLGSLPTTYDGAAFATNAAAQLAIRAQLQALIEPMVAADTDLMARPTAASLKALFDAGSPSLRSLTLAEAATRVDASFELIGSAAGGTWTPTATPPAKGGIYGKYLFSPRGLHLREVIEKNLYGGLLYNQATKLAEGTLTPAKVDGILALFGAHPSFPNNGDDPVNPDLFTA